VFGLERPLPPPPPPPKPTMATPTAVIVEEMPEVLLTREEQLPQREEALAVREEKARISKKALSQVSTALDMERT
jgi:hypothetical protein